MNKTFEWLGFDMFSYPPKDLPREERALWLIGEIKHLWRYNYSNKIHPRLLRMIPDWLVYECLLRASAIDKGIMSHEVVPDVLFMDVFSRWHDRAWTLRGSARAVREQMREEHWLNEKQ